MTTMSRRMPAAALGALALLSPILAGGSAAAIEPGKTFGDWQSECEKSPDGKPSCFLSQTRVVDDQKGAKTRLIKISAGFFGPNGQAVMVAILPLGVDLRAGAALRVDEGALQPFTFQQCLQEGCVANMGLDAKTLETLRKSKGAQVILRPYGGQQAVAIPVSTKGITEGLAALKP